jgi:hypothetical protein
MEFSTIPNKLLSMHAGCAEVSSLVFRCPALSCADHRLPTFPSLPAANILGCLDLDNTFWNQFDGIALSNSIAALKKEIFKLHHKIQQQQDTTLAAEMQQQLDRLRATQQRHQFYQDLHSIVKQAAEAAAAGPLGWTAQRLEATVDALNAAVGAAQDAGNDAADSLWFEHR